MTTNNKKKDKKEELLKLFFTALEEHVFIKETDSVSGEEEDLDWCVEDLEGIIRISGEWDREDLKNILTLLVNLFYSRRDSNDV